MNHSFNFLHPRFFTLSFPIPQSRLSRLPNVFFAISVSFTSKISATPPLLSDNTTFIYIQTRVRVHPQNRFVLDILLALEVAKVLAIFASDPHLSGGGGALLLMLIVLFPIHALAVDAKPSAFPQQPARVTQRYSNFLSFVIDAIDPAFPPHRRLFRSLGVVVSKEMLHVKIDSFQYPKDENERKRDTREEEENGDERTARFVRASLVDHHPVRKRRWCLSLFGDDSSAFPLRHERRDTKKTPPPKKEERGGSYF